MFRNFVKGVVLTLLFFACANSNKEVNKTPLLIEINNPKLLNILTEYVDSSKAKSFVCFIRLNFISDEMIIIPILTIDWVFSKEYSCYTEINKKRLYFNNSLSKVYLSGKTQTKNDLDKILKDDLKVQGIIDSFIVSSEKNLWIRIDQDSILYSSENAELMNFFGVKMGKKPFKIPVVSK